MATWSFRWLTETARNGAKDSIAYSHRLSKARDQFYGRAERQLQRELGKYAYLKT